MWRNGRRSGLKIRGFCDLGSSSLPMGTNLILGSQKSMRWLDIEDIAEALEEKFPDEDIMSIRFTDLKKKVLNLEDFNDDEKRCNEKILEAIQAAWINERL